MRHVETPEERRKWGESRGTGRGGEKDSLVYSAGGYQRKEASASVDYNGVGPTLGKRP